MIAKTIPKPAPPNLFNISFVQTCKHTISKIQQCLNHSYCWWFRNPAITSWLAQFNPLFTRVFNIQTVVGLGISEPSSQYHTRWFPGSHPADTILPGERAAHPAPTLVMKVRGTNCVTQLNMAGPSWELTHTQPVVCLSRWFSELTKLGYVFLSREGKLHSGSTQIFWVFLAGLFTLQVVYLAGRNKGETYIWKRPHGV